MELYKSHRCVGRLVGRVPEADGTRAIIVLETYPYQQLQAIPAHMCSPATREEVCMHIRTALAAVVEEAIFLGVDQETLQALMAEELAHGVT